jgi:hypothetical protein
VGFGYIAGIVTVAGGIFLVLGSIQFFGPAHTAGSMAALVMGGLGVALPFPIVIVIRKCGDPPIQQQSVTAEGTVIPLLIYCDSTRMINKLRNEKCVEENIEIHSYMYNPPPNAVIKKVVLFCMADSANSDVHLSSTTYYESAQYKIWNTYQGYRNRFLIVYDNTTGGKDVPQRINAKTMLQLQGNNEMTQDLNTKARQKHKRCLYTNEKDWEKRLRKFINS